MRCARPKAPVPGEACQESLALGQPGIFHRLAPEKAGDIQDRLLMALVVVVVFHIMPVTVQQLEEVHELRVIHIPRVIVHLVAMGIVGHVLLEQVRDVLVAQTCNFLAPRHALRSSAP